VVGKYFKLKESPVVFCFHSISEDGWVFGVAKKDFESLLREILKTKKIVTLKNLLAKKDGYSGKKVAITFDDGYENVFTSAYPILKKYGLTACVFVNTVKVKMSGSNYLDKKKLLSFKQIQKLKEQGWEIGYHTKSHSDLRYFNRKKLVDEIFKTKKRFEKKLGFRIDYFSYPYGVFNKRIVDIVKKAGYKYAFTANGGGVDFDKSPFKIGRVLFDKYIQTRDLGVLTSRQGLFFNKVLTLCFRIKDDYSRSEKL
jgi:peptidoglycan/xylan/chitin deacetylase (PgdA/CDA1 family)